MVNIALDKLYFLINVALIILIGYTKFETLFRTELNSTEACLCTEYVEVQFQINRWFRLVLKIWLNVYIDDNLSKFCII